MGLQRIVEVAGHKVTWLNLAKRWFLGAAELAAFAASPAEAAAGWRVDGGRDVAGEHDLFALAGGDGVGDGHRREQRLGVGVQRAAVQVRGTRAAVTRITSRCGSLNIVFPPFLPSAPMGNRRCCSFSHFRRIAGRPVGFLQEALRFVKVPAFLLPGFDAEAESDIMGANSPKNHHLPKRRPPL